MNGLTADFQVSSYPGPQFTCPLNKCGTTTDPVERMVGLKRLLFSFHARFGGLQAMYAKPVSPSTRYHCTHLLTAIKLYGAWRVNVTSDRGVDRASCTPSKPRDTLSPKH